ncbi:ESCRT-II complex subunit-domain-containing protein [Elsinoe ampelina]|uniref:Vacuolar protein-sorting-associated protein 25 n=1 Tax=Elsinoe ampelina TaxID=302913 RepID=A0A6A6GBU6_9PEZI|nr:ESCRT-II complex subunit-domain-containing protein [Elsinoe ampelina]
MDALTTTTPLPTSASPSPLPSTPKDPTSSTTFPFPPHHSFPPFFTLQPNLTTLSRQLTLWSTLIQSYCAHARLFRLSLSDATTSPLFHNPAINRRLDLLSIRRILDWMASPDGDRRAEYVLSVPGAASKRREAATVPNEQKTVAWVYWRRVEEWADAIYAWVDGTGQRGSVLTVYELREGEETEGTEWRGMDEELFRRCLEVLVKRGRAQVFNTGQGGAGGEGEGVKFF